MGERISEYQREMLQTMLRNPVPWCLLARTRSVLLRKRLIKPAGTCEEHGGQMFVLTERGRRSVTSPNTTGGDR